MNAGHFPMTGGGVLTGRGESSAAEGAGGSGGRLESRKRLDVREAETAQVRHVQAPLARDVAQRVAARVSVRGGIRHFADAYAVENNPDNARKAHSLLSQRGVDALGELGDELIGEETVH